jgi:phosphoglycerate kinase
MPVDSMIRSMDDGEFRGKRVLLRVDINSPIDKNTKKIINNNRIEKSIPTIRDLSLMGAKVAIIAHQGDTTDYGSLISLKEHAEKLSQFLNRRVDFIEDLAGPAAIGRIKELKDGDILLLENLRFLTEEVSTFEDNVKLLPDQMTAVHYVRKLSPLFDCYVNDAFSAAHRNCPSMVSFQQVLPSYGGRLLIEELKALSAITENPKPPCVYILGGSRAGDAFGMINKVLKDNSADHILTGGLVGQIFMLADGIELGKASETLIKNKGYEKYIEDAKKYLSNHRDKIIHPQDIAYGKNTTREEIPLEKLPLDAVIFDIGEKTVKLYKDIITSANTIFVNGPVGVYEEEISSMSTKALWKAIENAPGFTVIGGGDTVTSFTKFADIKKIDYVSTAGGALISYLSGTELPLLKAMKKGYDQ